MDDKFDTDLYDYKTDNSYCNYCAGFIEGAEWADAHPVSVWHDASEEPLKDRVFLAEFGVSKYGFQTFVLYNKEFNWNEWQKKFTCYDGHTLLIYYRKTE